MLLQGLYPSFMVKDAYSIEYEKLHRQGIRGILFDIDNTLVKHGAPADERAKCLFSKLQSLGYQYCFLSNNKEERVKSFCEQVGGTYIFHAGKPSTKGYEQGMQKMGTDKENTVFVGDQLFTDIWGANRAGLVSFLVEPIDKKEEIQIVLKRYLEHFVMWLWKCSGKVTDEKGIRQ